MTYEDIERMATALRALADFIEDRGEQLPDFYIPNIWIDGKVWERDENGEYNPDHEKTLENMRRIAREMKPCEKEFSGEDFQLRKDFGPFALTVYANRDIVCEKKQVGTVTIPARPERVIEAVPEHEEPVYEYDCGPLLS